MPLCLCGFIGPGTAWRDGLYTARLVRAIKGQFFLCYALMGAVLPYLPVYLRAEGLSNTQVGYVLGMMGVAILLTPVAITLLADAHVEARTLLSGIMLASGATLAGLLAATGFWPIFATHALFALAFVAVIPLLDGLNFEVQEQRRLAAQRTAPYHRIRVWGTVGFILPSLILYVALAVGAPISAVLVVGMLFGALGTINGLLLPRTRAEPGVTAVSPPMEVPLGEQDSGEESNPVAAGRSRLPTVDALRAMLQPHIVVFCVAIWLAQVANAAYYAFYPLYLTEQLDVADEWVGLITNLGVVVEVAFMLGFGFLVRWMGMRGVLALGTGAIALRLALLWAVPSVAMAIATQLLHGLHVLVVHVAPPLLLNQQAESRYRNSIQGLYYMAVYGSARIAGAVFAGMVADIDLLWVFGGGALLCTAGTLLFAIAYREKQPGA